MPTKPIAALLLSLSSWLLLVAAPASALELQRLHGSSDGEEDGRWLYFHSDTVHFALAATQTDGQPVRYPSLALFLSDGRDPEDLEPSPADYVPEGDIDPGQVWLDRDQRLIALLVGSGAAKRWHYIDAVRARLVAQTDAAPSGAADPDADPDLRTLPDPLPPALARYDQADWSDWRSLVPPLQRAPVMRWRSSTRAQFDALQFNTDQASLRERLDGWIGAYGQPATDAQLMGEWRVRSIQCSELGVFDYPWFKATITRPTNGPLVFAKITGSQRRSGLLLPDPAVADRLVFVGARTVNEEPPRAFSRVADFAAPATDENVQHDSVGEFLLLDAGHALMILDTDEDPGRGFEIYELRRTP